MYSLSVFMYSTLHVQYPSCTVCRSSCTVQYCRYSFQILMKLQFSRQFFFFKKYSNFKSYETPSSGSRVVPCGRTIRQTDRPDESNSRFPQFSYKPNSVYKRALWSSPTRNNTGTAAMVVALSAVWYF